MSSRPDRGTTSTRNATVVDGMVPFEDGTNATERFQYGDRAPGSHEGDGANVGASIRSYLIGLVLAALLTAGSFGLSYTKSVYGPGVPVALIVFAIAQVGVHLVFFLHLTTSPDNINNAMALAFGGLVIVLLIGGTLWIMMHMNQNMTNMPLQSMSPSNDTHMH